jgi:hypothetical protein
MPDRSNTTLTKALLALSPLAFETFVYKLVQLDPKAVDVGRNVRVGGTEVDVQATLDGSPVVFEAKRLADIPLSRADGIVAFAVRAREATGATRVILVAPARLSADAASALRNAGVEFWGTAEILPKINDALWHWLESGVRHDDNPEPAHSKAAAITAALAATPPGNVDALDFQKLWFDAAEFLFSPPLGLPQYEVPDDAKRNRRDIIIENFADSGFWAVARSEYFARYIVIDAKNYTEAIEKRSVLDVSHYLKKHGCGLFALLATRAGAAPSAMHAIREHWIAEQKMILVLDDEDLKRMLTLREDGADPSVVIRERLRNFIFSM